MPPLPLNLDQIQAARATLAGQRRTQRASSADLQRAKAELDALHRSGAQPRLIHRAEAEVARLSESVKGSAVAARESLQSIAALSERLLRRRDPSVMVQALATTHPVALLPLALLRADHQEVEDREHHAEQEQRLQEGGRPGAAAGRRRGRVRDVGEERDVHAGSGLRVVRLVGRNTTG